jgi:poly-beta-1,6-N-acetyl-D-glucosamine synthase
MTLQILQYLILILSTYSIMRIMVYSLTSNLQTIKQHRQHVLSHQIYYRPFISIIVPAHNEGEVIERTLASIIASDYPKSRMEIIVANDGSTDDTANRVRSFAARHRLIIKISLISRQNRGKAEALNYAIKHRANGSLVMCLDADSLLHKDCIRNSVQYFKDKKVVATASNVNIMENGTLLGLAQRFEYLFSHHFKKAHTFMNMEYIIGGVGSVFRKSILQDVSFYDSDTMTEDIDLTLKIIRGGNKDRRVIFASNAITYTEPVLSYAGLIKQRFRWKYGRLQSFYKNKQLFFATDKKYSYQLTFFLLPVTVLYEILTLFEPIVIIYILYLCYTTGSIATIIFAMVVFTTIIILNTWASDHLDIKDKFRLSVYAPIMYLLLYALVAVEYCAAIKSLMRLKSLPESLSSKRTTWKSPVRNAKATAS